MLLHESRLCARFLHGLPAGAVRPGGRMLLHESRPCARFLHGRLPAGGRPGPCGPVGGCSCTNRAHVRVSCTGASRPGAARGRAARWADAPARIAPMCAFPARAPPGRGPPGAVRPGGRMLMHESRLCARFLRGLPAGAARGRGRAARWADAPARIAPMCAFPARASRLGAARGRAARWADAHARIAPMCAFPAWPPGWGRPGPGPCGPVGPCSCTNRAYVRVSCTGLPAGGRGHAARWADAPARIASMCAFPARPPGWRSSGAGRWPLRISPRGGGSRALRPSTSGACGRGRPTRHGRSGRAGTRAGSPAHPRRGRCAPPWW
jgi:hypothetical protein